MKTVVRPLSDNRDDRYFSADGAQWMVSIDDTKFNHTHDSVGHGFPCDTDDLKELYAAIARALFEAWEQA